MSVAVAVNETGASGGIMVVGAFVSIVGGILSSTVTVAVAAEVLPLLSSTVTVTKFCPTSAVVKLLGVTIEEAIPQASSTHRALPANPKG